MSSNLARIDPTGPYPDNGSGTSDGEITPLGALRVGVILDSCNVPAWICYLLRKLSAGRRVELCLAVLDERASDAEAESHRPMLYRLWMAMDARLRPSASDALKPEDCRPLLSSGGWKPVILRTGLSSPTLSNALKQAELDLLLHLGHGELPREAMASAKLGTWLLRECDPREQSNVAGQFWDIDEGVPVITRGPQIVERAGGHERLLHRAVGISAPLSLWRNMSAAYWNIAEYLEGRLSSPVAADARPDESAVAAQPVHRRKLGNLRTAGFLMRLGARTVRHEIQKRLYREQWRIVVQSGSAPAVSASGEISHYIQSPDDRYYADPFLATKNGRTYVFFEDFRYKTDRGAISCCEVDGAGNHDEPRVVLACDYHLSYPFLFEWQGEFHMIPESMENRTIDLYRASDFPYKWVKVATLMENVAAADSTLFHHAGKWWLFTAGIKEHYSPNEVLFLYFADSPLGPWKEHPMNPIIDDPRCARPAGNLYFDHGKLIRPGQDCSRDYGSAIRLNQVDLLSETDYRESPGPVIAAARIPGSHGVHTFNRNGNTQVMDAKFFPLRFSSRPWTRPSIAAYGPEQRMVNPR